MSDLLAMSFDCLSSPTLTLDLKQRDPNFSGWGYGWYPNDDYAASVVKDSGSKDVANLTLALSDWKRFRSTVFLCKVRGTAKRYSQQDTQPFQKSFGGRDWLFLHNGGLDKSELKKIIGKADDLLEPVGSTDSELAFCYLIEKMHARGARRIADVPWTKYQNWLEELDSMGMVDIVFSDGQSLVVFHGKNTNRELYYLRRVPPHKETSLKESFLSLDFSDPLDTYRTAFLISSCRFNQEGWTKMLGGQMLVVRRAGVLWNSHENAPESKLVFNSPPQEQQMEEKIPFASPQAEQAQSAPIVTNIKSVVRSPDGRPLEFRNFKISHVTEYTYSKQVEQSSHILRLKPLEDGIQEIVRSTLSISVQGDQLQFEDVFGNEAIYLSLETPYTNLKIESESEIKVYATPPDDFSSNIRRTAIPLVWMPWQRQMMSPYLLPPELPEPQLLELTEFAMSFVEKGDYNLIETLRLMNQQIYKDFTYAQGETTINTTPFEVYTSRRGVCQDFANLFICLSRLLNIPSKYRVGYIYTGANYENKIQSDASHAWVEVYLPYVGWRGFDPTNGCEVGQDHIRVACGRNYRDATPTTGTLFKGGGTEALKVIVKVEDMSKS